MPEKKASKAASPPAEAPMPTMGKYALVLSTVSCDSADAATHSWVSIAPVSPGVMAASDLSFFLFVMVSAPHPSPEHLSCFFKQQRRLTHRHAFPLPGFLDSFF
ncbi:hypothetical protein [Desulfococcus multivorans]|uniref:hypothetical protein n=1 Tax=Desulfococcus multivorans TaxID=897 RepID=UPI001F188E8E|nr:hypothetical protein [Desulfococcus multivorans]